MVLAQDDSDNLPKDGLEHKQVRHYHGREKVQSERVELHDPIPAKCAHDQEVVEEVFGGQPAKHPSYRVHREGRNQIVLISQRKIYGQVDNKLANSARSHHQE